jgi:hypothetical protein
LRRHVGKLQLLDDRVALVHGEEIVAGAPVTIRRRYPISMAYRSLQKQHRSFVSRQTVFK